MCTEHDIWVLKMLDRRDGGAKYIIVGHKTSRSVFLVGSKIDLDRAHIPC